MNDILIYIAYWLSGFLCGWGFRGMYFYRQKDKFIDECIEIIKMRDDIRIVNE